MPLRSICVVLLALIGAGETIADDATPRSPDAESQFQTLCAECHGARRYGGYAPPLIPVTLERKSDDALTRAILEGLPSTQMPPFAAALDEDGARALVALLRQPPGDVEWTLDDVRASRLEEPPTAGRIAAGVRRENLVLVVERGTGQVVVLDGDRMRELDRFTVGRIHGGIKFDIGFHQALAVTRDGTLVDYDLDRGATRTRVKVGVNTRNIAVSRDGQWIAAANQLPPSLVLLDGRLRPKSVLALPGQPSAVYQVPGSKRFLLTLRDLPHLYFVDYTDYTDETDEASQAHRSELSLEKVELYEPFEDFVFVPGQPRLVASSRRGQKLVLYDYAKREVVAELATEGLPHLFSASYFEHGGKLHAAFNHMGVPRLSIIDMDRFELVREIPLLGAGYFTRTHPGTPYLWIDSNTESIQLVEKETLEPLDTLLTPAPGKKAMHVEFTAEGDKALVSIWDRDGAVVVYDSNQLTELLRIPFAMPVGKYNAANKTRDLR
jgi:mono/diheme cytochrome c family protein